MSELGYTWMIDLRGGVKRVDLYIVADKEREGWVRMPQRELGPDGNPKQTYYPAFDSQAPTRETNLQFTDTEELYKKDILQVEVF